MMKITRPQKTEIQNLLYPLKAIEERNKHSKNYQKDNYKKIQDLQKNLKEKAMTIDQPTKNESNWKMGKFKGIKPRVESKPNLHKVEIASKKQEEKKTERPVLSEKKSKEQIGDSILNKNQKEINQIEGSENIQNLIKNGNNPLIEGKVLADLKEDVKESQTSKGPKEENKSKKPPVPKADEILKLVILIRLLD